jgi:hypothetical protein
MGNYGKSYSHYCIITRYIRTNLYIRNIILSHLFNY